MASLVLHPRWKWVYFEDKWTGSKARFVTTGKANLKRLWESTYKQEAIVSRSEKSPELEQKPSFLESILDEMAPTSVAKVTRPIARRDQLFLYLEERPISHIGLMEYWRSRESKWPQLTAMAYNFLSIPTMSSECKRVFSSCVKETTLESSRLSGEMLWHQEYLKNWQQ